jgi:Mechanosensitive ion channel, beta-domain
MQVTAKQRPNTETLARNLNELMDRYYHQPVSTSNRLGVVEDITLISVRLRTLEQTLLAIPAGVLSQDSIENFHTGQDPGANHSAAALRHLRPNY